MTNPRVRLETTKGTMIIELFPELAPLTVRNFLELVDNHFYDGLTFHRAIPKFLIQTGCPIGDGTGNPGYTIPCECVGQTISHDEPGVVAMAHSGRDTGGSQFYITASPQPHLDNEYTIFGKVVEGLEVISQVIIGDIAIRITRLSLPEPEDIDEKILEAKQAVSEAFVETQKRIGLLPALSASIIIACFLVLAFRLLNLDEDPFFYQVELLLLLFTASLTGILTRSKLNSLVNSLTAFIIWLMTILDDRMPWALGKQIGDMGKDFVRVMRELGTDSAFPIDKSDLDLLELIFNLGIIIDLIVIVVATLVFGFFCSVIATGFFHKDGSFARITIITKPLALILVLVFLPLPLTYHGFMKASESSLALATGAALLVEEAGEVEDAGVANIENISRINSVFEEAQVYFDISRKAFDDLKANLLYPYIISIFGEQELQDSSITLVDFAEIAEPVLDALYYLAGAGPYLYGGIAYLMDGLDETFEAMGMGNGLERRVMMSQMAQPENIAQALDLDPIAFAAGLEDLEVALEYFNNASEDISKAYGHVQSIFDKDVYQELTRNEDEYISDAFRALRLMDTLIPTAMELGNGTIFFVMTAYSILLTIENLQQNEFDIAKGHLLWATENRTETESIIANALGIMDPNLGDNEFTNAFWGGIRALANMTALSNHFIEATSRGTDTLIAVNQTLNLLSRIDLNASVTDQTVEQDWQDSGINIAWAGSNISISEAQIEAASQLASVMKAAHYGNLNESMHDFTGDLLEKVGEDNQTGFWGNVTDFVRLISVANYTHQGFYSYAVAFSEYTNASLLFNATGDWGGYSSWSQEYIDRMTNASLWFSYSHANASAGEAILAAGLNIDEATRQTLANSLRTLSTEALNCSFLTESAANGSVTPLDILDQMTQAFENVQDAQGELANAFTSSGGILELSPKRLQMISFEIDNLVRKPMRRRESGLQNSGKFTFPLSIVFAILAFRKQRRKFGI